MADKEPAALVDAATILLLRDGPDGRLEVFMVVRHHQIDFASGALVFPGGKVTPLDRAEGLKNFCDGAANGDARERAFRLGAIREAFEESGVLLSQRGGRFLSADELILLEPFRARLDAGEVGLEEFLQTAQLRVDLTELHSFAHWITPTFMPKRFDTRFYLAEAPKGQVGSHDGREMVDSVWINPRDALDAAARKERTIIFPTRMNLEMLSDSETVADAIAAARRRTIVTVEPELIDRDGKKFLIIPAEAGYPTTEENLESALKG